MKFLTFDNEWTDAAIDIQLIRDGIRRCRCACAAASVRCCAWWARRSRISCAAAMAFARIASLYVLGLARAGRLHRRRRADRFLVLSLSYAQIACATRLISCSTGAFATLIACCRLCASAQSSRGETSCLAFERCAWCTSVGLSNPSEALLLDVGKSSGRARGDRFSVGALAACLQPVHRCRAYYRYI